MADAAPPLDEATPKRAGKSGLIGLCAAIVLGAGGFFAAYSGLLTGSSADGTSGVKADTLPDIAFVAVTPLIVSLGAAGNSQHLRFSAQLEVPGPYAPEVTLLVPRILDVLNSYLRAVDMAELEDPTALVRIRAQMLRRIQIVTGEGRVRDLLVTEFVLN